VGSMAQHQPPPQAFPLRPAAGIDGYPLRRPEAARGTAPAAEEIPADTADEDGSDDGSSTPADDIATETAQVPARPKPPADRRVLAVAGVLGDYPDGATIDEIAEATGYKYGAVALRP